jgi:dTDP-4-dehydrorhamnose reductase
MRVLITGSKGQLGRELIRSQPRECEVTGVDLEEVDISIAAEVTTLVSELNPLLIINAAAYTAVDGAESERDQAFKVNQVGAECVAVAAQRMGARLIHISTDFVFEGNASRPYHPEDPTGPINVYGRSKLEGEWAVTAALPDQSLVIRTSWLYSAFGRNFVKTMLNLMQERNHLSVVSDQFGSPTWAKTLSEAIWLAGLRKELSGILHWCDSGSISWYDFAAAIHDEAIRSGLLNKSVSIEAIESAKYPTAAKRPRYSVLDTSKTSKLLGLQPPDWRDSLRQMLEEYARGVQ